MESQLFRHLFAWHKPHPLMLHRALEMAKPKGKNNSDLIFFSGTRTSVTGEIVILSSIKERWEISLPSIQWLQLRILLKKINRNGIFTVKNNFYLLLPLTWLCYSIRNKHRALCSTPLELLLRSRWKHSGSIPSENGHQRERWTQCWPGKAGPLR